MTTFADLGLSDDILRAIQDVGYTTPTPIQEQAIPYVLMMRDLLGCAQTGTGKTAGFVLPMLEMLGKGRARARMPRSLILEPTRELAAQVAENFELYGKYHKLSMALLIGGTTMDEQIRNLDRGVDVLIATPGRMLDLFERGKIMLNDIKIFVIDEADRMLDMGFIPDVEKIGSILPPIRQTLFFSATMPPEIRKLADRFLSNPKTVTVAPPATTSENVKQIFIPLPSSNDWQKREALRMVLKRENVQNAFIFCNRKRDVALLHKSLVKHGFNAGALHGDMEQSERTATLDKFKRNEYSLLVCSDVAARGLDVEAVSHVFNFDVPFNADDYVHRIGRTGRAGRSGTAYTLLTPEDDKNVAAIEHLIKKKIDREVLENLPEPDPRARSSNGRPPRRHGSDRHRDRRDHQPRDRQSQGQGQQQRSHSQQNNQNSQQQKPRPQQPRPQQDNGGDDGHLPAFLRRPSTIKSS
ncbi:MAG TPA: DEAD/DEAH box helicase [Alphaproteobacteria bacterium]|nr:DEAD/DEAH box helicase [Alphaproteobacteria bacterium]